MCFQNAVAILCQVGFQAAKNSLDKRKRNRRAFDGRPVKLGWKIGNLGVGFLWIIRVLGVAHCGATQVVNCGIGWFIIREGRNCSQIQIFKPLLQVRVSFIETFNQPMVNNDPTRVARECDAVEPFLPEFVSWNTGKW